MCSVRTERFASPLNCDVRIPRYFSAHPRDRLFGAEVDAFSVRFSGSSYMNPEYEDVDLYRALRWAIEATTSEAPALTVGVYPRWDDKRYMGLLGHPNVHILAKYARNSFSFLPPDHFKAQRRGRGTAKWPVLVFVVANEAGLRQYWRGTEEGIRHVSVEIGANLLSVATPGTRRFGPEQGVRFRPFARRPRRYPARVDGSNECAVDGQAALEVADAVRKWQGWERELLVPEDAVYTDGSKTGEGVGAGFMDGAWGEGADGPDRMAEGRVRVPRGGGVLESELTAILYVLRWARPRRHLVVVTDSLVSLCKIERRLRTGKGGGESLVRWLLTAIQRAVDAREETVDFRKVRAHIGVPGNEYADSRAKEVATGEFVGTPVCGTGTEEDYTEEEANPGGEPAPGPSWWPEMKGEPGEGWTVVRASDPRLMASAGKLHRETYRGKPIMEQWEGAQTEGLCAELSNAWWGHVSCRAVKQVCRARYGEMFCGYWRQKVFGTDPKCQARGDPNDNWAHVLLRCEHHGVRGAITNRHHAGVRALASQLRKGSLGRWLTLVSAGNADGDGEQATVPGWMCPDPGRACKPDIVIVKGWPYTAGAPGGVVRDCQTRRVELIIIEFTCTGEAMVQTRQTEKAAKYEELRKTLRGHGWRVGKKVEAIAMGVRGGVSVDMQDTLARLGVAKRARATAVRAIQTAVLEGNVNVVKAKRQAEGRGIGAPTREPRTGRRRKKPGTLEEGLRRYQNRPRQ